MNLLNKSINFFYNLNMSMNIKFQNLLIKYVNKIKKIHNYNNNYKINNILFKNNRK